MSKHERGTQGTYVEVRNNDVGRAMRKLKKLCNTEGLTRDLRDRRFYTKPSMKKKREAAAARKRWKKQEAKLKDKFGI
jgi:small subunit ribosomal protein S21